MNYVEKLPHRKAGWQENFIELNMVEDFYLQVSMLAGSKMKQRENTLIFIDEIHDYYTADASKYDEEKRLKIRRI